MNMKNKIALCGVLALFVVILIVASMSVSAYGQKNILVDLTHAERISIDGTTSPNLDTSINGRIFNWTDWADYMRGEGYVVDVLTEGPISTEKLEGYNILIVAQPDNTTSGPAHFTTEESAAIATFVENGGGLLLMGTQFVGGSSLSEFMADYDTVYHCPEVHNALLANLGVGMRFAEGMIGPDPYDVLVEDDIADQVGGPKGNIWVRTGDKTHPIWDDVTDGKFAYWHGCSINVTDPSINKVATGDDNTYTSVKNADYSPVVKPSGSYPVAIAAVEYGNGKVVAYGDAGCWQGSTPFGDVFTNSYYHEQEIASNLIAYLCEPFEPPTPFSINGWVFYDSGTACNNPSVTITNMDNGKHWETETYPDSNYYQIMLASGSDLNVSEMLQFNVTDGTVYSITTHEVTQDEANAGGIFGFNLTLEEEENIFDTRTSVNPYPSIFGVHNGTLEVTHPIVVERMYTYACTGTGGHSESVKIWNATGWNVNASWDGYKDDWHTITFDAPFTLEAGKTYNYTIRTGSYPQIHHTDELEADGGTIWCTEFVDANGKVYNNWIPAIRFEGA